LVLSLSLSNLGCASLFGYRHTVPPEITLPIAPVKPKIDAKTIKLGDIFYLGYTIQDSVKLYEFLLAKEAQVDKLEFRIKEMNILIKNLSIAK